MRHHKPIFAAMFFLAAAFILSMPGCGGSGGAPSGGFSADVNPANPDDVVIEGNSSRLTIPAGTFAEAMTIKLSEGAADTSTIEAIVAGTPVTLEFSRTQLGEGESPMMLAIRLPESFKAPDSSYGLYAMVLIEGERIDFGDSPSESWRTVIGSFDAAARTYSIPLNASAGKISVVLVASNTVATSLDGNSSAAQSLSLETAGQSKSAGAAKAAGAGWGSREWALVCLLRTEADRKFYCDFNTSTPESSVWHSLAAALPRGSAYIQDTLGFAKARLYPLTAANILLRANSGGSTIDAANPNPNGYNVAYIVDDGECGTGNANDSCYDPATGTILFHKTFLEDVDNNIRAAATHEIFHAVQQKEIPAVATLSGHNWILEGTADFVGRKVGELDVTRNSYTDWRNWQKPLRSEEKPVPYETSEFWGMLQGGDVGYIKGLFEQMKEARNESSYKAVDDSFAQIFGEGLDDLFIKNVLPNRFAPSGYTNCAAYRLSADNATEVQASAAPMSSRCYDFTTDDGSERSVIITLEGGASQRLLIDDGAGTQMFTPAQTPVTVTAGRVGAQVANIDMTSEDNSAAAFTLRAQEDAGLAGTWCSTGTKGGIFVLPPAACLSDPDYWGDVLQIKRLASGDYYGRYQQRIENWGFAEGTFANDALSMNTAQIVGNGSLASSFSLDVAGNTMSGFESIPGDVLAVQFTKVSANPFADIPGITTIDSGEIAASFRGAF